MHKLVIIGTLGSRMAYLDIDREAAIRRYLAEEQAIEPTPEAVRELEAQEKIDVFEFEDSFGVYDAWR